MEWAVSIDGGPEMNDWQKLSDFQASRVRANDDIIWLQSGLGAAFKMARVPCENMILFQACTRHAAESIGGTQIIIRDVVSKVLKFESQAVQQADGLLSLVVQSSVSGNNLCEITVAVDITVSKLKAVISSKLLELNMKTPTMPICFSDPWIKDVSGMRKLFSVFVIINGKVNDKVTKSRVRATIKK